MEMAALRVIGGPSSAQAFGSCVNHNPGLMGLNIRRKKKLYKHWLPQSMIQTPVTGEWLLGKADTSHTECRTT